MNKIVLFIEPNEDFFAFSTPEKIGHLFTNRFAVDENASFEILNVLELGKSSEKMSYPEDSQYQTFENESKEKGIGLLNMVCILESAIE